MERIVEYSFPPQKAKLSEELESRIERQLLLQRSNRSIREAEVSHATASVYYHIAIEKQVRIRKTGDLDLIFDFVVLSNLSCTKREKLKCDVRGECLWEQALDASKRASRREAYFSHREAYFSYREAYFLSHEAAALFSYCGRPYEWPAPLLQC